MKFKTPLSFPSIRKLRLLVRKTSIKNRLFFVFSIVIAIVLFACYMIVSSSLSSMKSKVELHNDRLLHTINENIKLTYEHLEASTIYPVLYSEETFKPPYTYEYLSSSREEQLENLQCYYSTLNTDVRNLFNRYKQIDLVAIVKPNGYGEYIIKTEKYYTKINNQCKKIEIPQRDIPWIQTTLELDGSAQMLSNDEVQLWQEVPDEAWLYCTRSIVNANTLKSIGFIVTGANIRGALQYFDNNRICDDSKIGLFDKDGKRMMGSIEPPIYYAIMKQVDKANPHHILKLGHYQFLYSYIRNDDGTILMIETPYRYILSTTLRNELITIFLMISVLLLVIIMINLVINSMTKPLYKLERACNTIEDGDFSIYIVDDGHDEITEFTSAFNSMTKKIQILIDEGYKKDLVKSRIEMQMLRSQINPHFLYNTLEAIRSVAYAHGEHELSSMVLLLVKTLRYGISELSSLVTVETERDNLQDYIRLQTLKNKDKVKFNVYIDHSILEYKIIKLILQPIVENAIYHGMNTIEHGGEVTILGTHDGEDIIFQVIDNGVGIDQTTVDNLNGYINSENKLYKSIGIKNVNRRIKLFYGEPYGVKIQSSLNQGTMVSIRVPKDLPDGERTQEKG